MTNLNQKLTEAIHGLIPEAGLMCSRCGGDGYNIEEDVFSGEYQAYCNHCRATGMLEPELRHVLWALKAADVESKEEWNDELLISIDGEFTWNSYEQYYPSSDFTGVKYDLTKSLFKQEESAKEWLLNLLTKES